MKEEHQSRSSSRNVSQPDNTIKDPAYQNTLDVLKKLNGELRDDLEATPPREGINRFLKKKRPDITPTTLDEYERELARVEEFCNQHGIDDLREFDSRTIDEYEIWLRYEASDQVNELATKTMRDELYLLRDFLGYLEKINAVRPGLSTNVDIPEMVDNDGVRNIDVDPERLKQILEHLEKFAYATLEHLVWLLPSRTGRRESCLIALDVPDAHVDTDDPYLEFRHRPPETRLKNQEDSEGQVAITNEVAETIKHYLETNRPNVTDEEGREPLLATPHGRISKSTFRRYVYKWSRPCAIGNPCPHDRDPEECEATQSMDHASKCPSSRPPHALRHGYISEGRRNGVPIEVLSDRCDVSEEIIRKHYDESTQEERREIRREILDEYTSDNGGGYL